MMGMSNLVYYGTICMRRKISNDQFPLRENFPWKSNGLRQFQQIEITSLRFPRKIFMKRKLNLMLKWLFNHKNLDNGSL